MVEALSAASGGSAQLPPFSLTVGTSERVALVGENGAGKTTLLRSILGLHPATWANLEVAGSAPRSAASWRRARRATAWIPQSLVAGTFPVTGHQLFAGVGASEPSAAVARRFGIDHVLRRPIRELSGGQLQRVLLARAFGQIGAGASLLLADEPTNSLDADSRETFLSLLQDSSCASLIVTHDPELIALCDRRVKLTPAGAAA